MADTGRPTHHHIIGRDQYPTKGRDQYQMSGRGSDHSKSREVDKAAVTADGSFLVLSSLTLIGTVIALIVATPSVVFSIPIPVSALITVALIITIGRDHYPMMRQFLVIVLLLSTFCIVGATQGLTINSSDGDIIDCIDRFSQLSFGLPILRNHNFEETPTPVPGMIINDKDDLNWQIWHRNGINCPEGTISKRRFHVDETSHKYISVAEAARSHEYAIGTINKKPLKIYGTKVTMSVWHPNIERSDEFSLGQVWLASGHYKSNDINTIEAGWQVSPKLYSDYQPRLFILWTSDTYENNTCYNLRCGGFIQTSRSILIEGAISPASVFGTSEIEMTIQIWKDPKLEVWWLGISFDSGTVVTPVGYWPVEIFTRLTDYADIAEWGGEIINKNISGRHTTTQMGSGYLPNTGKGAYMCNIEIATNRTYFEPSYDLVFKMTNKRYYKIKKFNNTCFSYGGPEHAGVISLKFDFIVIFLCVSIFMLI